MLTLEKKPEKPPMLIELEINTPIGRDIEKIFELIKKIDELRDPTHGIHLKISSMSL